MTGGERKPDRHFSTCTTRGSTHDLMHLGDILSSAPHHPGHRSDTTITRNPLFILCVFHSNLYNIAFWHLQNCSRNFDFWNYECFDFCEFLHLLPICPWFWGHGSWEFLCSSVYWLNFQLMKHLHIYLKNVYWICEWLI